MEAGGATPKDGDHAGLDGFVWFFGVVEDRNDPLEAGRVRVRVHGFHTADKSLLPTDKLPWSQCIMPVTSASLGGIGSSSTGLVEGSFVLGFYTDGKNRQQPIVLGSLGGIAGKGPGAGESGTSPGNGFNDPDAIYPKKVGKADTPSVGVPTEFGGSDNTTDKLASWVPDVSVASRHKVSKVGEDKNEDKYPELNKDKKIIPDTWSEPLPRGGKPSAYPYNHVTVTESGHVIEIDDTKGGERIHQYHRTGTFYEIQPDGNRVTKVVGSDYEIIIKDKNVYIQGACNVTIKGDVKMLCEGDLVQEVNKNYHLTVHGDMITKIGGNQLTEISSDRSTNVDGKDSLLVSGSGISTIGNDYALNVGKGRKTQIGSSDVKITAGTDTTVAGGGINFTTPKSTNISSVGDLNFATAGNIAIKSKGTFKLNVEGAAYQTYKGESHFRHEGNAFPTYKGESHFRHEGHFKFYYGADTSKDFAAGTDHVAPSPARSGDSTRNTASEATSS